MNNYIQTEQSSMSIPQSNALSSVWLAPLDFDMSSIEINYKSNDEVLQLELSAFRLTLGGGCQASMGVTSWMEMSDDPWRSARWLYFEM